MQLLRNMTSIYLRKNGKILLLFRQGSRVTNNKWIGSAGGHFEKEELNDCYKCVLREMKEEINLDSNDIANLKLRYITVRYTKGEIRQNYYFFADLISDKELESNEGKLKWFEPCEISDLEMPFTAKHMISHYLKKGCDDDKLYVGVANKEKMTFQEINEF